MANEQAAVNSAPNASVTAQQPVQGSNLSAVPAGQPAQAAQAPAKQATPAQAAPAKQDDNKDKDADKAAEARKEEVKSDQKVLKGLSKVVEGRADYFTQMEEFGKAFEEKEGEDSFRRAARIEREREAAMSAGDPTRDPVAKQAAMDANMVLPGAKEDAQKIKDIGAKKLEEQSVAHKGVK